MLFPRDRVHLPCPHPPGHHLPEHINMYAPGELCLVLGSFRVRAEKPVVGAAIDGWIDSLLRLFLSCHQQATVYD